MSLEMGRDVYGAQQHAVLEADLQARTAPQGSLRHLPMHRDSSQINDCLNPARGIRDLQIRQGIQPVNHARQNLMAIRQQSAANRERRITDTKTALEAQSRQHTPSVSRRSSGFNTPLYSARSYRSSAGTAARTRSEAGDSSAGDAHLPKGDLAVYGPPRPEAKHSSYGRVPSYLRERQLELAEAHVREQADKEAALIPKGMRILGDAERLEMLSGLENSKREVEQQIQGLPLRIVTIAQKRHKAALEQRFEELEEAITIFSKPKVLVETDDNDVEAPHPGRATM